MTYDQMIKRLNNEKRIIKAWIMKKLKIASPSCCYMGYKYEYDMLKGGDKKEVE